MRDPNRIYGFCGYLAGVWRDKAPDLRFAQFVEVVFQSIKEKGKDPFYIEETEMKKYIGEWASEKK